jgi:hypothetical protein
MELLLSSLSLAAVAEVALIRFVAFAAQITKKIVIATEKVKARDIILKFISKYFFHQCG